MGCFDNTKWRRSWNVYWLMFFLSIITFIIEHSSVVSLWVLCVSHCYTDTQRKCKVARLYVVLHGTLKRLYCFDTRTWKMVWYFGTSVKCVSLINTAYQCSRCAPYSVSSQCLLHLSLTYFTQSKQFVHILWNNCVMFLFVLVFGRVSCAFRAHKNIYWGKLKIGSQMLCPFICDWWSVGVGTWNVRCHSTRDD
jgi:hypothetical protein